MNNVGMLAIHPERTIVRVFPGSVAEQAGVLLGDRIETINGKSPASRGAAQFRAVLQESSVSLTLAQTGHPRPIALTLHTILCWLLRISVLKKSANDGSTSSFS